MTTRSEIRTHEAAYTNEDVIKDIEMIKSLGWGRVEAVIGEGKIVEINVLMKRKKPVNK